MKKLIICLVLLGVTGCGEKVVDRYIQSVATPSPASPSGCEGHFLLGSRTTNAGPSVVDFRDDCTYVESLTSSAGKVAGTWRPVDADTIHVTITEASGSWSSYLGWDSDIDIVSYDAHSIVW